MEMACECSDALAEATFNCIRNYDAGILDQIGRGTYEMVIGMLDLESMEKVMAAGLAMHCNEVGGEACYQNFADQMRTWGKMVDRSMKGAKKKDCSAFSRVDKQMRRYVKALEGGDMSEIVESYYGVAKKASCSKRCAKKQADEFYSCCWLEAVDLAEEHELGENIGNIIDNVWSLLSNFSEEMGDMPISREDIETYLSTYNPEEMCADSVKKVKKVYRRKRKQCDEEKYEYDDEM